MNSLVNKEADYSPVLSIIIPTKERPNILKRTLESLSQAINNLPVEVVIVNDSPVEEIQLPEKVIDNRVQIIRNTGSGAAAARNNGVKYSSAQLLLFLDDDIIITRENLLRTLQLHQKMQEKVCFNFMWEYPPDLMSILPEYSFGRYILKESLYKSDYRLKYVIGKKDDLIKEEGISSQYFSISRFDFESTGGYDENIPFAGVEDVLLARKLKDNGIKIYLSARDKVYQYEPDRLQPEALMERYRKGALTCRVAHDFGYTHIKIDFPMMKASIYRIAGKFKPSLLSLLKNIPNSKFFDPLYNKLVNLLLGTSSYHGYRN